jgi:GR25 family glycosyltransferase involved in LPS biosynthesis
MKFCHKVFHLDKDTDRSVYVKDINTYLRDHSKELYTPTIGISSQEEYNNFIIENHDFPIDPLGYNLDNVQGWKYGEIGIWASNFLAYKNFLNTDFDYLILMEDDILFDESYMPRLIDYMSELPEDWDLFSYFVPKDQKIKYQNHHDIERDNVCLSYQDWSMLCYVINKKSASKILNMMQSGFNLPLDWYFYRQTNIFKCYTVKPWVTIGCTLASIESTFQTKENRKVLV